MKVFIVLAAVVAVALADGYTTKSYGYATEGYKAKDTYNSYDTKSYSGYDRKDSYGKNSYGRDSYGHDSYGKDSYGKDSYGRNSYKYDSKDSYGKDSYGYQAPSYGYADNSYNTGYKQPTYETKEYNTCGSYGYGSYMYNTCTKCSTGYEKFVCPKEYIPGGSYTETVKVGYAKSGYDHKPQYKTETRYYAKSQKFIFAHTDKNCYYQCDAAGKAVARPCPRGTSFDAYANVCSASSY